MIFLYFLFLESIIIVNVNPLLDYFPQFPSIFHNSNFILFVSQRSKHILLFQCCYEFNWYIHLQFIFNTSSILLCYFHPTFFLSIQAPSCQYDAILFISQDNSVFYPSLACVFPHFHSIHLSSLVSFLFTFLPMSLISHLRCLSLKSYMSCDICDLFNHIQYSLQLLIVNPVCFGVISIFLLFHKLLQLPSFSDLQPFPRFPLHFHYLHLSPWNST